MKIKILLTGLSFFLALPFIQAQIAIETDTLFTKVTTESDIVSHNSFTNMIPQQKTFRWTRNVIEITNGWTSAVCDDNQCYLAEVDSEEITLGPNASSLLDVHLYNNQIYEGYAFIEMTIAHSNDPGVNTSAFYVFDSQLSTSVKNPTSFQLNIYPNPSSGLFQLDQTDESIAAVKVINTAGKEVLHIEMGQRQWMDLSKLPGGTYIVRFLDRDLQHLGSKLVNKI